MRSTTEIDALIERTEKKIAGLRKDEKAAQKSKAAFAPLTRCDVQLRIVDAESELLSLHREKLAARIEEIDRELIALSEEEGLALEDPAAGSKQATLEAEQGSIRAQLDSRRWPRNVEALQNRRRQIEADRELEATEQAEAIEAELATEAEKVAADVRKLVDERVMPVRERWRQIAAAYSQYERARGVNRVGRLDAAEFPISVSEISTPIPMVLRPEDDPTIRTPVPTA